MRTDILERQNEIIGWINENQSKAFICKQLSCKESTLDTWLKKIGISYSGNRGGKGIKQSNRRKSAIEYLRSSHITSYRLKLKLFADGVKDEKCECCGITEWQGQKAPLELHHIDGNRHNNELENLQILCSNCHSLTPNNSGRSSRSK